MKKILLSVSCLLAAVLATAQSPTFEWAKNTGGYYGLSIGTSIVVDATGNVYTTGYFEGRVDFDPGAGIFYLTAAGLNDIFITKTDASGNFIWAKQLGGISDDRGNSIAIDGSGNICIAGYFSGTADFDPGTGTFNLISAGGTDVFICMLSASGNLFWAHQFGSTGDDLANAVAINGSNYVYTTGDFIGNVDFDPGVGNYNLSNSGNFPTVFISKLNISGNFVWAKQLEGTSSHGKSIAVDPSGNVYSTGHFYSTIDLDPGAGTYNLTSLGSQDIYISKLNASGNFLWGNQLGGSGYDQGNSIAVDASGNVYTTGTFSGTGDFDPGLAVFNLVSLVDDIFISKLDASGNFVWAYSFGNTVHSYSDNGNSIFFDGAGNIYVTGNFSGTVDFDPGPGTFNLTSGGGGDIFVLKLNALGNFAWAKLMGGTSYDHGISIAVDGTGNVYTTGYFSEISDFNPGAGSFTLIALGGSFMFTSKLDSSGNFVWAMSAGAGAATFAKSMTTDLAGNVYTAGYFYGIVDFDPGPGIVTLSTAATDLTGDVFVTKCNVSGNLIWAKQLGGISQDYANSIAVDAAGNVYTAGNFNGTADFDPGAGIFNLTASSSNVDIFVSKLNASGNFVWATKLGSTTEENLFSMALDGSGNIFTAGNVYPGSNSYQININKVDPSGNVAWSKQYGGAAADAANAIATDVSGNIYITGYFNGTADLDPGLGTYNLTAAGGAKEVFVSKLDGSGNFIWAKQLGGANHDEGSTIAVDASGRVYVGGYFNQTADFDPGPGTYNLTSAAVADIFISKLDNSGNFIWAKQFAGNGSDNARSIVVDNSGNVYTTGIFYGTTDFDPGVGTYNLTSANVADIFISKLDASGNFIWAQKWGGAQSDQVYSIALDGSGNVYTSGTFYETVDFDPGSGTSNLTAHGNPDFFIHKLSQCTPPSAAITPAGPTTFCSGGNVVLNAPTGANKTYQWKKGGNLISGATLSSYTATTGGNYRVIVTNTATGCSKTTGSATVVTVNTLPAAIITPQGPTTFCAGGSVVLSANTGAGLTYKWKKGSNFISGATLSNYTATTGGNYKVQATNSNGCSKTSGNVAVSVPCKEGESEKVRKRESEMNVSVFPNPNSGEFTIKFSTKPTSPIQIELTDEIGKVVKRFETNDETVVIKESNLAKGIYCLTVRNKDEVVVKKINIVK